MKVRGQCTLTLRGEAADIHVTQDIELDLTETQFIRVKKLLKVAFESASSVCMEKLLASIDVTKWDYS